MRLLQRKTHRANSQHDPHGSSRQHAALQPAKTPQTADRCGNIQQGPAKFTAGAWFNPPAKLNTHCLLAITNAKNWHLQIEYNFWCTRRISKRHGVWPTDRIIPFGLTALIFSESAVQGRISVKTPASLKRRAINCVTCDPKSIIRIESDIVLIPRISAKEFRNHPLFLAQS